MDEVSRTAEYYEAERRRDEEFQIQKQQDARRKLIEPYTDGLPYNRDRVVEKAKHLLYQSFESVIECGKMMIWIREEESGQTFAQILNQFFPNLSKRTVTNFMRLARVSVQHPKLQGLIEKQRSKAIALLEILNEEDLTEFDEAETIAGMAIDDVEKMSARQLKDELRSYKKKIDRGQEQLKEAETKIEGLKQEIHSLKTPPVYDSEEQKYIDIIREIGWKFEYILLDIKTKLPFDRETLPGAALKHLLYFLLYMSRETLNERQRLCQHYDGAAEDMPWEPGYEELPPAEHLEENTPHIKTIMTMVQKRFEKKQGSKGQVADGV